MAASQLVTLFADKYLSFPRSEHSCWLFDRFDEQVSPDVKELFAIVPGPDPEAPALEARDLWSPRPLPSALRPVDLDTASPAAALPPPMSPMPPAPPPPPPRRSTPTPPATPSLLSTSSSSIILPQSPSPPASASSSSAAATSTSAAAPNWAASAVACVQVGPETRSEALYASYCVTVLVDVRPPLASLDARTGVTLLDECWGALEAVLAALARPSRVGPGHALEFIPEVLLNVVAVGEIVEGLEVLAHGVPLCSRSLQTAAALREFMDELRGSWARLECKLAALHNDPSCRRGTTQDLRSLLQSGAFSLKVAAPEACPVLIYITDGTLSHAEQPQYDSFVMRMAAEDISVIVVRVGPQEWSPGGCGLIGYVPDVESMRLLAAQTGGEYYDLSTLPAACEPVSDAMVLASPIQRAAFFRGAHATDSVARRIVLPTLPPPDEVAEYLRQGQEDYEQAAQDELPPLFRSELSDYTMNWVDARRVLEVRAREGFRIESISRTESGSVQVAMRMPWTLGRILEYTLVTVGPPMFLSASNAGVSEERSIPATHVRIAMLAPLEYVAGSLAARASQDMRAFAKAVISADKVLINTSFPAREPVPKEARFWRFVEEAPGRMLHYCMRTEKLCVMSRCDVTRLVLTWSADSSSYFVRETETLLRHCREWATYVHRPGASSASSSAPSLNSSVASLSSSAASVDVRRAGAGSARASFDDPQAARQALSQQRLFAKFAADPSPPSPGTPTYEKRPSLCAAGFTNAGPLRAFCLLNVSWDMPGLLLLHFAFCCVPMHTQVEVIDDFLRSLSHARDSAKSSGLVPCPDYFRLITPQYKHAQPPPQLPVLDRRAAVRFPVVTSPLPSPPILFSYMHHSRWLWTVPLQATSNFALELLVRRRISEGLALVNTGVFAFIRPISVIPSPQLLDVPIEKLHQSTVCSTIQYVTYITSPNSIVTELWVEPQVGHVILRADSSKRVLYSEHEMLSLLRQWFYLHDSQFVTSAHTFDTIVSLLQAPAAPKPGFDAARKLLTAFAQDVTKPMLLEDGTHSMQSRHPELRIASLLPPVHTYQFGLPEFAVPLPDFMPPGTSFLSDNRDEIFDTMRKTPKLYGANLKLYMTIGNILKDLSDGEIPLSKQTDIPEAFKGGRCFVNVENKDQIVVTFLHQSKPTESFFVITMYLCLRAGLGSFQTPPELQKKLAGFFEQADIPPIKADVSENTTLPGFVSEVRNEYNRAFTQGVYTNLRDGVGCTVEDFTTALTNCTPGVDLIDMSLFLSTSRKIAATFSQALRSIFSPVPHTEYYFYNPTDEAPMFQDEDRKMTTKNTVEIYQCPCIISIDCGITKPQQPSASSSTGGSSTPTTAQLQQPALQFGPATQSASQQPALQEQIRCTDFSVVFRATQSASQQPALQEQIRCTDFSVVFRLAARFSEQRELAPATPCRGVLQINYLTLKSRADEESRQTEERFTTMVRRQTRAVLKAVLAEETLLQLLQERPITLALLNEARKLLGKLRSGVLRERHELQFVDQREGHTLFCQELHRYGVFEWVSEDMCFVVDRGDASLPPSSFAVPHWLVVAIEPEAACVIAHRADAPASALERNIAAVREAIARAKCRANQQLLLRSVLETHICPSVLVQPEPDERALSDRSSAVLEARGFRQGEFRCPLLHVAALAYHERLAQLKPAELLANSKALVSLQVTNRRLMFVYRAGADGSMYYMRLHEHSPRQRAQDREVLERAPQCDPAGNYLLLAVYGTDPVAREIEVDLHAVLAKRLEDLALKALSEALAVNPNLRLTPHDVAFVQPLDSQPTKVVVARLPPYVASEPFAAFLNQSLMRSFKRLRLPVPADSNNSSSSSSSSAQPDAAVSMPKSASAQQQQQQQQTDGVVSTARNGTQLQYIATSAAEKAKSERDAVAFIYVTLLGCERDGGPAASPKIPPQYLFDSNVVEYRELGARGPYAGDASAVLAFYAARVWSALLSPGEDAQAWRQDLVSPSPRLFVVLKFWSKGAFSSAALAETLLHSVNQAVLECVLEHLLASAVVQPLQLCLFVEKYTSLVSRLCSHKAPSANKSRVEAALPSWALHRYAAELHARVVKHMNILAKPPELLFSQDSGTTFRLIRPMSERPEDAEINVLNKDQCVYAIICGRNLNYAFDNTAADMFTQRQLSTQSEQDEEQWLEYTSIPEGPLNREPVVRNCSAVIVITCRGVATHCYNWSSSKWSGMVQIVQQVLQGQQAKQSMLDAILYQKLGFFRAIPPEYRTIECLDQHIAAPQQSTSDSPVPGALGSRPDSAGMGMTPSRPQSASRIAQALMAPELQLRKARVPHNVFAQTTFSILSHLAPAEPLNEGPYRDIRDPLERHGKQLKAVAATYARKASVRAACNLLAAQGSSRPASPQQQQQQGSSQGSRVVVVKASYIKLERIATQMRLVHWLRVPCLYSDDDSPADDAFSDAPPPPWLDLLSMASPPVDPDPRVARAWCAQQREAFVREFQEYLEQRMQAHQVAPMQGTAAQGLLAMPSGPRQPSTAVAVPSAHTSPLLTGVQMPVSASVSPMLASPSAQSAAQVQAKRLYFRKVLDENIVILRLWFKSSYGAPASPCVALCERILLCYAVYSFVDAFGVPWASPVTEPMSPQLGHYGHFYDAPESLQWESWALPHPIPMPPNSRLEATGYCSLNGNTLWVAGQGNILFHNSRPI
eukprot:m51a1_g10439 hypothetical protein (2683) ;mRNA; r:6959-19767